MDKNEYIGNRKSFMEIGGIFFDTNKWQHLLQKHRFKAVIIQSVNNLSERKLMDVFAFTIMPNYIHFIWRVNSLSGKETA